MLRSENHDVLALRCPLIRLISNLLPSLLEILELLTWNPMRHATCNNWRWVRSKAFRCRSTTQRVRMSSAIFAAMNNMGSYLHMGHAWADMSLTRRWYRRHHTVWTMDCFPNQSMSKIGRIMSQRTGKRISRGSWPRIWALVVTKACIKQ